LRLEHSIHRRDGGSRSRRRFDRFFDSSQTLLDEPNCREDVSHFVAFATWTRDKGRLLAGHLFDLGWDLFWCYEHDIDGRAFATQVTINGRRQVPAVELASLDDQKIDVAVGAHFAARSRAEQDNLVWLRRLDDAPNNVGQSVLIRVSVFATARFGPATHTPLPAKEPRPSPRGSSDGRLMIGKPFFISVSRHELVGSTIPRGFRVRRPHKITRICCEIDLSEGD
jgi:hypothetical protein